MPLATSQKALSPARNWEIDEAQRSRNASGRASSWPLWNDAARSAEGSNMASLFDVERELNVARFHADHGEIEQALTGEFGLPAYLGPLGAIGRQPMVGNGDSHFALHAGILVYEGEPIEQCRFRE